MTILESVDFIIIIIKMETCVAEIRECKGTEFVWKLRKRGICEGVRRAFILIYTKSCSRKMNLHGWTSTTPPYECHSVLLIRR